MADVLNRITRSSVAVEGRRQELLRKLALLDVLGKRGVVEACGQNQVLQELGLHDLLLDQLTKDSSPRTSRSGDPLFLTSPSTRVKLF